MQARFESSPTGRRGWMAECGLGPGHLVGSRALPFSCPFRAPTRGSVRQTEATVDRSFSPGFTGSDPRFGTSELASARPGKSPGFGLRTRKSRNQPQERARLGQPGPKPRDFVEGPLAALTDSDGRDSLVAPSASSRIWPRRGQKRRTRTLGRRRPLHAGLITSSSISRRSGVTTTPN